MKAYHYVYKITDPKTNQFYFGSRSCECNPEEDNYMGSYCVWEPEDKSRLKKEIIKKDFQTRKNAFLYENELIEKYWNDPLNENYHKPIDGFDRTGTKHTDETKNKISKSCKENEIWWLHKSDKELDEIKQKMSNTRSGKSWEEIYGVEVANKLKKNRSEEYSGEGNPMHGKTHNSQSIEKILNRRSYDGSKNPRAKKVKCLKENCCGNAIYDTIKECSEIHNIHRKNIRAHINGNRMNIKFKFVENNT